MARDRRPEPLYRKVNTRARRVHHHHGGDFRHERNTKEHTIFNWEDAPTKASMGKKTKRGLDYTPLFRFLLSRVGKPWKPTFKEALNRLDKEEPIWWMVQFSVTRTTYFRTGESTYWSRLFVDEEGILRKVDPELGPEKMEPFCTCCTHTLNGKVFR